MKYNVYTGEFSTEKHIGFRWLEFTFETQIYDGTESHVMYLIVDIKSIQCLSNPIPREHTCIFWN